MAYLQAGARRSLDEGLAAMNEDEARQFRAAAQARCLPQKRSGTGSQTLRPDRIRQGSIDEN